MAEKIGTTTTPLDKLKIELAKEEFQKYMTNLEDALFIRTHFKNQENIEDFLFLPDTLKEVYIQNILLNKENYC